MDTAARQERVNKFDSKHYVNPLEANYKFFQKTNNFTFDWAYAVFSEGNMRGELLLDVGTGPNIKSLFPASSYFNKIYLSDFSMNNIKFLEEWRHGNHKELMRNILEEVVKREGNTQTAEEKETNLLEKISGVFHCNVLQENPLTKNEQPVPKYFDAITTSWCLDTAAESDVEFQQALRNLASLIRPGGYLVHMGIKNYRGGYDVNGVWFPGHGREVDQITSMFDNANMKVVNVEIGDHTIDSVSDFQLYNILAKIL